MESDYYNPDMKEKKLFKNQMCLSPKMCLFYFIK